MSMGRLPSTFRRTASCSTVGDTIDTNPTAIWRFACAVSGAVLATAILHPPRPPHEERVPAPHAFAARAHCYRRSAWLVGSEAR